MRHSSSYEDFRRERLKQGASTSGSHSHVPSFGIRKAKSEPDVGLQNMQKNVEVVMCVCVCKYTLRDVVLPTVTEG